MTDRLPEIKQDLKRQQLYRHARVPTEKIDWLIQEVERLRMHVREERRQYDKLYHETQCRDAEKDGKHDRDLKQTQHKPEGG